MEKLTPLGSTAGRSLIFMMSVSLDGLFEGPNHELDWQSIDAEVHQHFNDELREMSMFLDGRVTYELMAGFWPTADEDPSSSEEVREFSRIWRDMPKIVYSTTLQDAGWNTTIVRDIVADDVNALKSQPGNDMVIGGADAGATFMRLGLIDEFRLYLHPVVMGQGNPLFRDGWKADLDLVETRTFGNGVVLLRYQPSGSDDS